MKKINIAIDGPAGAGKSTVARLVANRLNFVYVDTGAMYRAVTYRALQRGLFFDQTGEIARMAGEMEIRLLPGEASQRVLVDGVDVTDQIRSKAVTDQVSRISQIPEIRRLLVSKQQRLASDKGVVMDGRDIGSKVLPDAEVKIFLTASVDERARRRYDELVAKGQRVSLEQLKQDIAARDHMDETRDVSPLVRTADAVLIDTTGLSIPQVVEQIIELCRMKAGDLA